MHYREKLTHRYKLTLRKVTRNHSAIFIQIQGPFKGRLFINLKSYTHCGTHVGVNFDTFYVIFVYFAVLLFHFIHIHFFSVFTCKYTSPLKKAKAESTQFDLFLHC